jgi:hypothetical protein
MKLERQIQCIEYLRDIVLSDADRDVKERGLDILLGIASDEDGKSRIGEYEVEYSQYSEIVDLLIQRKKIQAIKRLREITGEGLKDTKTAIDKLEHMLVETSRIVREN